jgi:hypothetical protein
MKSFLLTIVTGSAVLCGLSCAKSSAAVSAYGHLVNSYQPVAYWRLGESTGTTAADEKQSYAGTYRNGVVLSQTGPLTSDVDTAAAFDGVNDYVSTGVGLLNSRSAFTITAWIRPAPFAAARVGICGQNDAVELGFISPTQIQLWTPLGGSLTVNYPFPRDQWHHVAAVGNGSSLKLYFDGAIAGTAATSTANYGTSVDTFNIGGGGVFDATGNYFVGSLDEVAIFHTALSDAQISRLFTIGRDGSRGVRVRKWVEVP